MRRAVLLSATIFSLVALEATSRADIPPLLRSGTHPMWASLSLGGALSMSKSVDQFKLIETFGIHFTSSFGGPAAGPAIAIDLQESFGGGATVIEIGPKFCWDIPIIQNLGFYLSPSLLIGYAGFITDPGTAHAATIQIGFEGKLILGDRGLVFFRPMTIDIIAGEGGTSARWDLMFGGGVIF